MLRSASIRAKLIAIVMATSIVSLLLTGVSLASFEFIDDRNTMSKELATVADIIGANSTAALTFDDPRTAHEILAALASQPDVVAACLYDAEGRLFADYRSADAQAACPEAPEPDGAGFRNDTLVRSGAVMLDGQRIGTLRLVATLGELQKRLHLYGVVLAAIVAASALAALLISAHLQGLVSRPILELAGTAKRVSDHQDYTLRAPKHTNDEIGVAVSAFNQMLERIQDADRALREAGEKSREQAQFLRSILDNMGEGMVACDLTGKFLLWNPAATRLVGSEAAKLDATEWPRHFGLYREDKKTLFDAGDLPLVRAMQNDVVTDQELYIGPPSERSGHWISTTARPFRDENGQLRGAIAVFRDVSDRKRTEAELRASEAQLRQAQKMEAVGQLAGGIAHDFNNLLTAICGYSMLALSQLPQDHPMRGDLQEILKAGERAASLTHQLLAFSRKQVLAPKLLNLNAVVSGLDKMLRRVIGEDIDLVSACAPDLGAVKADPGQLEQIILNLAVNARDAMPRGGKLTIETANCELDQQYAHEHIGVRPGAYVLLSVTDTGVGMDAATQSHVFEPFFTTKEKGKGTGLGLSTVYGIVQQSGGHVAIYSEVGRGTSVKIYLPRSAEPADTLAKPSVPAPAPAPPHGTETILLAEDEEPVRRLTRDILTGLGYTVLTAIDGIDALQVMKEHDGPIHLLITDVVMPRMGGPELAHRLVELVPGIGVLFLSGYAADAIAHQGVLGEEPAFMQKPFTPDALARKTRELLGRPATSAPAPRNDR